MRHSPKEGSFSGLVEAMRQVCRAEWRHDRIVALGELKTLRKREGQGVADFCVELEQLTRRAHPHMDEVALDAERAQLLFEQLAHWGDSYHLMEALESENHAYDRLKQTALGIERRDLTLRRTGVAGRTGSGRSEERHKAKPPRGEAEPTPGKDGSEEPRAAAKGRRQLCYNCHEAGHLAKECPMKGTRSSGTSGRGVVPLSARLLQPACQAIYRTGAGTGAVVPCPLTGKKSTTVVNVFGRKWTGLLDTGSEVSIIPAKVLLKAKEDGHDIDREVVEHHLDPSMRVYDAAGKIMRFVTVVEVKLKEGSDYQREVVAKMLVSRATDDLIILGTNVLPSLGYELERRERDKPALGPETEMVENRYNENELPTDRRESKTACVARRTYLAPGAVVWVGLRGCDPKAEYMLASTHELIYSGVCSVGASGVVEVPVVNRSEEPAVLRAGEAVGRWEKKDEEWKEVAGRDVPDDLFELKSRGRPKQERLATLRALLIGNRKEKEMPGELWRALKENHDVFAVDDSELTQTHLVAHEIDTGNTAPIRQRTRPVPIGAREKLKAILSDLLERGIIKRSRSPWASPVVLVRKKDGSLRLCVDYRELNKHTRQDAYPLPTVDAMLQSLQGKRVFTSLDLCSGYWQIPLSQDARSKSAFTTPEGLFKFTVLPFGLSTSPAEFQRLMDRVLGERRDKEVFVYIDDILIATESEERHYEVLREVLQALREANLKLKAQAVHVFGRRNSLSGASG